MIEIDFDKGDGLIPAIVQDAATGEVLMMAYMNRESWEATVKTGKATFWSRVPQEALAQGRKLRQRPARPGDPPRLRRRHASPQGGADRRGRVPTRAAGAVFITAAKRGSGRSPAPKRFSIPRRCTRREPAQDRNPQGQPRERHHRTFQEIGLEESPRAPGAISRSVDDPEIRCTLVRAQEMSRFVETGTLDVGLTGKDWILENGSDIHVVQDLVYSKASLTSARWVLVVAEDSPIRSVEDCEGKKIFTELVSFTRQYFASRGVNVSVEFSWGATEGKVIEGLADAIVEVTETGSTLRANKLRIVEELLETCPQLIANKASYADPWKREKIEQVSLLLQGALQAEGMVGLKMNVPANDLKGRRGHPPLHHGADHRQPLPDRVVLGGDGHLREDRPGTHPQAPEDGRRGDHRIPAQQGPLRSATASMW